MHFGMQLFSWVAFWDATLAASARKVAFRMQPWMRPYRKVAFEGCIKVAFGDATFLKDATFYDATLAADCNPGRSG